MKDIFMLAGFGLGLITGAMLYKHSQDAKKMMDNGENTVMKEAEKIGQKAEQGAEKVAKTIKKGNNAIKKQMQTATSAKK